MPLAIIPSHSVTLATISSTLSGVFFIILLSSNMQFVVSLVFGDAITSFLTSLDDVIAFTSSFSDNSWRNACEQGVFSIIHWCEIIKHFACRC